MTTAIVRTILNYKNYEDWKSQIKTYLLAEDLWDIIDEGTDECPKTEDEEKAQSKGWKKDAKALYAIQNSCGDDTYQLIKDKTTAKQAWDTLSEKVEKAGEPSNEKANKSVGEAYPTPTPTDDNTTSEVSMEEGRTEGAGHGESIQETFVKYVESNDWDNAIKFLRQHPQAAAARVSLHDGTALHYAIRKKCSVGIIQQLVELMDNGVLEKRDNRDYTALYDLIRLFPDRVDVAKCMLNKNPNLLTFLPRGDEKALVAIAQANKKGEEMARYLYSFPRPEPETIKVIDAAQLISDGFRLQRFDIAWDLIQRYPKLAIDTDHDKNIPLGTLASNRFAFKSGRPLNSWDNWIYDGISIKPLPPLNKEKHESEQSDQGQLSDQEENQSHHLISSGMDLLRRLVANLQILLGSNRIYEIKLVHERVNQFLPLMCESVRKENMSNYQSRKLDEALYVAVERGHVEYITHLFKYSSYPVLKVKNEKLQSLFQIVVECRQYRVYNLMCELLQTQALYNVVSELLQRLGLEQSKYDLYDSEGLKEMVGHKDELGNNMLHAAARITPLSQIDHIQGAALQMQRELQWFKEVENIADPKDCESINKDNKTPQKVFTENHKELGEKAEKSMKETATSCTVVGALIVTIMFAVAFTVPGGNDEEIGLSKVFTTFIVSDAISLFSSTTSIIMFLGILTSRYSQDDFHKSLPIKMIIGLVTLFLSIATMMVVFSCGLYIILDGKSSIVIPSILLAGVPVASFIWMQFPLLKDLSISTFGRGIFNRKQKNLS